MSNLHRLLGVGVAVLWGINFLALHASLQQFPPFLLVAIRFAVLAIPTILFIPFPQVRLRWLIGYGIGFGTLQFAFLFLAMDTGMPTGLASLILQSSAPFTVLLGATWLKEKLNRNQVIGICTAVGGLALVGTQQAGTAAMIPFLLTLCAGLGWAFGNLCSRQAHPPNPVHLTLWISVVPPLPMLALSLLLEGPGRIADSFTTLATPVGIWALIGLAYTVVLGTVVGTGAWTWLMSRYPASRMAPFSMLVPVVGLSSAWLVLGETVNWIELLGGAVIVAGVLFGSRAGRGPTSAERPAVAPPISSGPVAT